MQTLVGGLLSKDWRVRVVESRVVTKVFSVSIE